jgi:Na+-transporting NADH:ubiquinone oxidoreductase subunit NqrB
MKDVFIKSKINLKKINIYLFISLLPLIIAGFYKNGINLYTNHLVSFPEMLKPLIFDILGLAIGISVNIIHERIFRKSKDKLFNIMFASFHPFYGLLIASIISINTNIFLFIMITFLSLMISKFFKSSNINIVALTSLLIIFCINLTSDFSFLNKLESNNDLNLIALDYLLGKGSGGINATNVFVLIISLLILCNQSFYKKNIPLYSTITYLSCMLIYCIITSNIGSILDNIFANNVLFSFVFIATEPLSSPYTYKGQIIYSIIIGILTFVMYLIYPPLAALGGIIIASICHKTIDKFFA